MPATSSGLRARSVGSALPPPSWKRSTAAKAALAFSDQFEGNSPRSLSSLSTAVSNPAAAAISV